MSLQNTKFIFFIDDIVHHCYTLIMNEIKFINRKGGMVLLFSGRQFYKQQCYDNGDSLWNSGVKLVAKNIEDLLRDK